MLPIKKIICTTDFSDASFAAIQTAEELARQYDAEVILTHIVAPIPALGAPHHTGPAAFDVPAYQEEFVENTRSGLEALAEERFSEDIRVRTHVSVGYPADEVTDLAAAESADLIVIATHGHTGFQRLLLGSVTERVIRFAPCPVLSIRSQPAE